MKPHGIESGYSYNAGEVNETIEDDDLQDAIDALYDQPSDAISGLSFS